MEDDDDDDNNRPSTTSGGECFPRRIVPPWSSSSLMSSNDILPKLGANELVALEWFVDDNCLLLLWIGDGSLAAFFRLNFFSGPFFAFPFFLCLGDDGDGETAGERERDRERDRDRDRERERERKEDRLCFGDSNTDSAFSLPVLLADEVDCDRLDCDLEWRDVSGVRHG